MKLPILMSVPHAGLRVPDEVKSLCILSDAEVEKDGDEGAAEIYDLAEHVLEFVTSDVARAIVDLNRDVDDRRADGIVKTHTCWNEQVYCDTLSEKLVSDLLHKYYHPYHQQLSNPTNPGIKLCVDCHTMAAKGPPIGPDVGAMRPGVCLGDAQGKSLPKGWIELLAESFRVSFSGFEVTVNKPFSGGYITRFHGQERPWLQIELSRASFLTNLEKQERVLSALSNFCQSMFNGS